MRKSSWTFIFLGICLMSWLNVSLAQSPVNMTVTLETLGACATQASFKVGARCQMRMTIQIPVNTPTNMHVELFTSDNSSNVMTVLCRPSITIGLNYNLTTAPIPQLTSSLGDYRFDQAVIDFGVINNQNTSLNSADYSIVILFDVVVIDNGQTASSVMWITAGAEYYNGDEIWIGQTSLTFDATATGSNDVSATFSPSTSTGTAEIGKFGTFSTNLTFKSKYFSLKFTATSAYQSVKICSIHIKSAGWCYLCLNSFKAYLTSKVDKLTNTATLDLGYLVNLGFPAGNTTTSTIEVFVAYKVSPNATLGYTPTVQLTAAVGYASGTGNLTSSFTHTITYINPVDETAASTPTVNAFINNSPVPIYGSFNITIAMELPNDFNNMVKVDVIPNQNTLDNSTRVKICSIVAISSGENIPCAKCVNDGYHYYYSQNDNTTVLDSVQWTIGAIRNYNLRTVSDMLNVNQLNVSIIGQVLNNPMNTPNANITIPVGITFGNQTIWVAEAYVIVGAGINYTNASDSMPTFSMSIADTKNATANIREPRAFFFDMYTQPGSIYMPMNIEVVMPETLTGSDLPAATICTLQIYYVGAFSSCAQKNFINDPQYNRIGYFQRMLQFKNDKAILTLDSLCNSGDPTVTQDPIDSLIRFLIYFQLTDDVSVPDLNYLAVGVQYTLNEIYVGQLSFNKGQALKMDQTVLPYTYTNSSQQISVQPGDFGVTDFLLKLPPGSQYSYNIKANLKTNPATGLASFCTIRTTKNGLNVPCNNPFNHSFTYSLSGSSYNKQSDYINTGSFCSINNETTSLNRNPVWDEDSVNLQIITRPSSDSSLSYSLEVSFYDGFDNSTIGTTQTITWSIAGTALTASTPLNAMINSTLVSADPTDPAGLVYAYTNVKTLYIGQTHLIRYNFTLPEPGKFYQVKIKIENSIASGQIEFVKFFISNVGNNFPCQSQLAVDTPTAVNGFAYTILLDIGEVAYYPIDPTNSSASTITFEAFLRIPYSSKISDLSTMVITVTPLFSSNAISFLTKQINTFQLGDLTLFNSTFPNTTTNFYMRMSINSTTAKIRDTVSVTVQLNIPLFYSLRTIIRVTCVDIASGQQFAHIKSLRILSAGRNVDSLMNEYNQTLMPTVYNTTVPNAYYYKDSAVLDLGIVTNTAYGQKLGNYVEFVDDTVTLQVDMLVIDDPISAHLSSFNYQIYADLNNNVGYFNNQGVIKLNRLGTEKPELSINATFKNDTTTAFGANSMVVIRFDVGHTSASNAEAYNCTIVFYLPAYITIDSIVSTNSSISYSTVDSAVFFKVNRIRFEEIVSCEFKVIIDQGDFYKNYIDIYGTAPPSKLSIPYNVLYYKYARTTPTADSNTFYYSTYQYIQYTPASVSISAIPSTPMLSSLTICQFNSSVEGTLPANVRVLGWTTGLRSIYWYQSGSTYIQFSFGTMTRVAKILMAQMADTQFTTFSKYQISFSSDGFSYAFLPEMVTTSTSLGNNITYVVPNKFVECRFLRIHIKDIATPSDLASKQSGLRLYDIIGASITDLTPLPTCYLNNVSNEYAARSYLYIPQLTTMFVCDETLDRLSSECYMSTDSAPTNWLVVPKIVATVTFWVRDQDSMKEFIYGVGYDKVNFVRSDDGGFTWKAISPFEYYTMSTNIKTNTMKYLSKTYVRLSLVSSTVGATEALWSFSIQGVSYNSVLRFDWFS